MALRTDEDSVAAIIEVDEEIALDPFMTAANLLVNRIVAPAEGDDDLLYYEVGDADDDAALTVIETWLAAHFYAIRDPRNTFTAVSSIMDRFQSQVDLNLSVTHYGQQAMVLDTSGALAAYNRTLEKGPIKRRVGVTWLGTDPDGEDDT